MDVHLWHNPRCSKSREALALLRANGVEPIVREYLEDPPDAAELTRVLGLLGRSAADLMRRDEAVYRELGLDADDIAEAARIAAMVAHPMLIQRPVAMTAERAVIGRPPERVLELLPANSIAR
jgi:arsenate reductase (glutaredoxin)